MAVAPRRIGAARLAAGAPVPVYAVAGTDMREKVETLLSASAFTRTRSPRHAVLLLVAGEIPASLRTPLHRLHDQLPHPRASLWWGATAPRSSGAAEVGAAASPANALVDIYRDLCLGRRPSEPDLLPDVPPAPWDGLGEHGQGGEGMMGGRPYGRPMAMSGEDRRDGLSLDESSLRVGPFLPAWPPGLVLRLTLQGDVIQRAEPERPPLRQSAPLAPFLRALKEPVPVAELERGRAAHHLSALARFLATRELDALSRRFFGAAAALAGGAAPPLRPLKRWLALSGAVRTAGRGLGRLRDDAADGAGGPAMRAAGVDRDARGEHAFYRRLGFRPVTRAGGDVRARLEQWLGEAEQAVALAAAAGDRVEEFPDGIEGPTGFLRDPAAPRPLGLDGLLDGLEWDEASVVLSSFDVPALRRLCVAPDLRHGERA